MIGFLKFHLRLLCALIFVGAAAKASIACSCAPPPPPCVAFGQSSAVFIGRFVKGSKKVEYKYNNNVHVSYHGDVTFEVLESFVGTSGKTIELFSDVGCCDVISYVPGETYLVYAHKAAGGKLIASYRTRSAVPSEYNDIDADLEFLRHLPKPGSGIKIYGSVTAQIEKLRGPKSNENSKQEGTYSNHPLVDVVVTIKGEKKKVTVKTDGEGKYSVTNLPPGKYIVEVAIPAGHTAPYENWKPQQELTVQDCGCGEAGYWFKPNGKIKGQVFSENNRPAANVTVQLISASWQMKGSLKDGEVEYNRYAEVTDENGFFEFGQLSSGSYLLGVSLSEPSPDSPYTRIFYPGVADLKQAAPITLGFGQETGPFVFHLKQTVPSAEVSGKVLWPDGKPAVGVKVRLRHPTEWLSDDKDETVTDDEGHFILKGLLQHSYKLAANWHSDSNLKSKNPSVPSDVFFAEAQEQLLKIDSTNHELTLILKLQKPK